MKQHRYVIAVLAFFLAFPMAISAQNLAKGSIGGTVYDTSGAVVPDAKVSLTSEYGSRETKTGSDGMFVFLSLEPGKYRLKVEFTNFKMWEIKDVSVRLNERTTLDVRLEPGAVTQTVTVTEGAVGIDTSTTTSGGTITSDIYKNLPVGHGLQDIPYLVAGVNDGLGTGHANPSISGATGLENIYIVNGVNITNAGYGALGTYSNIYGSLGSGVQFDFVKEVQVKTSGYEANYGQALGGVVNVITKSGGNTYHGGAYFYGSPDLFEARRRQSDDVRFNKGTILAGSSAYDVGGELGGYLIRDRLFWFGAYDHLWNRDRLRGPSGFAAAALGDVISKTSLNNYSGKVSYNLTANQNHQVEGSVFGDPATGPLGPHREPNITNGGALQTDFPQRRFSTLDYGSRNWSVRYTGALTPSWLVTASFSWARNTFTESAFPNIYRVSNRLEA
ncbi:MAG TPA: TonB-dependent receptor, partial [Candidatus Acidoferrales bacterium]|nr:TonB-dependent receptor [Candidatus Acidoferrales bacterium]